MSIPYSYRPLNSSYSQKDISSSPPISTFRQTNYEISNKTSYSRNNSNINEHIKNLIKSEANLKLELSAKNNQLSDYEKCFQEKDTRIINLNQIVSQLENKYKALYDNFEAIRKDYESLSTDMRCVENEKRTMQKKIENIEQEIDDKNRQIEKQNELIYNFQENASVMKNMSNEIENLNKKCAAYQKQNETLIFDINSLRDELKGQQNLNCKLSFDIEQNNNDISSLNELKENLKIENGKLEEEIKILKESIRKIQNENSKKENDYKASNKQFIELQNENLKYKNELSLFVSSINEDISSFARWIENYLPIVYSYNVKLPEMQLNSYQDEEKQIKFSILKNAILNAKIKIDGEIIKLQNENKNLKYKFTAQQDENVKNQQFLENLYKNLKNEIESHRYFNIGNDFSLEVDPRLEIETFISKILSLLCNIKENNKNDLICQRLSNENEILKSNIYSLSESFQNLQNENLRLRDQLHSYEQIKFENEKNLSNPNSFNFADQQKEYENTIHSLEVDKENLIKDNINLIKENQNLKKKLFIQAPNKPV